jgi:Zn-dependent protease
MTTIIISISVFLIAIVLHELAHGYMAYKLGDPTAKIAGRLTLNPIAHLDPFGTVLLPAMLIFMRSPVIFGWAKPVPINSYYFKNPRRDIFLTSLAGPGANFVLAVGFATIFKTGIFPQHSPVWMFLLYGILINLVLGIFNLIPIPPLDGSNILVSVLPADLARSYVRMGQYGFIILFALLYLGLFDRVILPLVSVITKVLIS